MADSVTCPSCGKKSVEKFCGQCGLDLQGKPWEPVIRHLRREDHEMPYWDFAEGIWKACEKYHGIVEPKEGD